MVRSQGSKPDGVKCNRIVLPHISGSVTRPRNAYSSYGFALANRACSEGYNGGVRPCGGLQCCYHLTVSKVAPFFRCCAYLVCRHRSWGGEVSPRNRVLSWVMIAWDRCYRMLLSGTTHRSVKQYINIIGDVRRTSINSR